MQLAEKLDWKGLKLMNVKEVNDILSVCTSLKHWARLTDLKNLRQIQSTFFRSWLSAGYSDFMILPF
jgi:hypothetical protein